MRLQYLVTGPGVENGRKIFYPVEGDERAKRSAIAYAREAALRALDDEPESAVIVTAQMMDPPPRAGSQSAAHARDWMVWNSVSGIELPPPRFATEK